ncbi:uncharacterized protein LOC135093579 [Scylla paramamosain]|uniref:uncharacterized protein LOC135093579 n=1 Tax=Scylla paramamosain TaxID=85552 RepID=UPI0030834B6D
MAPEKIHWHISSIICCKYLIVHRCTLYFSRKSEPITPGSCGHSKTPGFCVLTRTPGKHTHPVTPRCCTHPHHPRISYTPVPQDVLHIVSHPFKALGTSTPSTSV